MLPNDAGRTEFDPDLATVLALERELQTPECRRNRGRLVSLFAEDFTEVGASGAVWDKTSILELLGTEDSVEIEVLELSGRAVGTDFVLVHWISQTSGKRARRTSLWRRATSGWESIHHQGTPLN
ncbi:DUF4440 domain-containing protein [Rhodococcus ruber]|uniref:DUF4440 domain-containing protein n=1 Tax=Rhodococcus ruber TaxID=1830 RepID=A0ABT4MPY2_9NOCA|nr:DUF4440 domain-containing protein [Rhodococcus ruber]MCZ4522095.1 DUF4440 domain-containing protein [Rhodococcus ruber]